MIYVLFIVYLSLFSWLLTKSRFVLNVGLPTKVIIGLFVLKVGCGCFNFWVTDRISGNSDTWLLNVEGVKEYNLIFNNTKLYLENIFYSPYDGYGNVLASGNSYWNDLSNNIIIKFLSICDIFSLGNLYVNVIFYNYFVFFGIVALFRVFDDIFKNKRNLLIISCFLLPSLLFYSSAILKDGLIYASLGLVIYILHNCLQIRKCSFKHVLLLLLILTFIFLLRSYVCITLVPALLLWIICQIKNYRPLPIFIIGYFLGCIMLFNVDHLSSKINLLQSISNKQDAFKHLKISATYINVDTLKPTFKSFISNAPQAISHSLLRPYLTDIKLSKLLFPQAIEILLYELLFLIFIFYANKELISTPFIVFLMFFSFSVFLIIGYTVPIIGAIVRYRSIYLPFLISPLLCTINWQKLRKQIQL